LEAGAAIAEALKERQKLGSAFTSNKAEKNHSGCRTGMLTQGLIRNFARRPERQHAAKGDGELMGKRINRQGTCRRG
jgi:hypothetical protein